MEISLATHNVVNDVINCNPSHHFAHVSFQFLLEPIQIKKAKASSYHFQLWLSFVKYFWHKRLEISKCSGVSWKHKFILGELFDLWSLSKSRDDKQKKKKKELEVGKILHPEEDEEGKESHRTKV